MRVLVMGAPGPATEDAVSSLERAGHEVVRCNNPGEPPFPCKGLTGTCPLDEQDVDVALAVRARAWARPTVFDRGVSCAVRARVPVVLAGTSVLNPYEKWATEVAERHEEVVEAVERAASGRLASHDEVE